MDRRRLESLAARGDRDAALALWHHAARHDDLEAAAAAASALLPDTRWAIRALVEAASRGALVPVLRGLGLVDPERVLSSATQLIAACNDGLATGRIRVVDLLVAGLRAVASPLGFAWWSAGHRLRVPRRAALCVALASPGEDDVAAVGLWTARAGALGELGTPADVWPALEGWSADGPGNAERVRMLLAPPKRRALGADGGVPGLSGELDAAGGAGAALVRWRAPIVARLAAARRERGLDADVLALAWSEPQAQTWHALLSVLAAESDALDDLDDAAARADALQALEASIDVAERELSERWPTSVRQAPAAWLRTTRSRPQSRLYRVADVAPDVDDAALLARAAGDVPIEVLQLAGRRDEHLVSRVLAGPWRLSLRVLDLAAAELDAGAAQAVASAELPALERLRFPTTRRGSERPSSGVRRQLESELADALGVLGHRELALELPAEAWVDGPLTALATSPAAASLRALSVRSEPAFRGMVGRRRPGDGADEQALGERVLQTLFAATRSLRHLDLGSDTESVLSRLPRVGLGDSLVSLRVAGAVVDRAGAAGLASWLAAAGLERLELLDVIRNDAMFEAILGAEQPALGSLSVSVPSTVGGDAWRRVFDAAHWPSLHTLSIDGASIGEAEATVLAGARWHALRVLRITGGRVRTLRPLLEGPGLERIERIDLTDTTVDAGAIREAEGAPLVRAVRGVEALRHWSDVEPSPS